MTSNSLPRTRRSPPQLVRARRGIRSILFHSLKLATSDHVLLITDENHIAEALLFTQVARRAGMVLSTILVPLEEQARIRGKSGIPSIIRDAIAHSSGLIVLIDYSSKSTAFRLGVLEYFRENRPHGRAASMPGVTFETLHYADTDYHAVDSLVQDLGKLLLRADRLRIVTRDENKHTYALEVALTDNPSMCGSVIEEGDWDNVPTGETFVLPKRRSANGQIAINGSVPGLVLNGRASAVLDIAAGRIIAVQSNEEVVATAVKSLFFKDAECYRPLSLNANVLSEVGFGANKTIPRFHGSPIFDEKIYGTIHVAFGRNEQLGGKIKGRSHHDLVVTKPTVFIAGLETPILALGKYTYTDHMLELDWRRLTPRLKPRMRLERTGVHTSLEPRSNALVMEWMQCCGPKAITRVGDAETAMLAGAAFDCLSSPKSVESVIEDMQNSGFPRAAALAAIEALRAYGLLRIRRAGKE